MVDTKKIKMGIISGASHALKYKQKHPEATDHEIIQYVSSESDTILDNLND
ncbi:MAG: hypothetical protein Q7S33_05340 [Nanoarchaeota archaeon]|nr:hypothetical protein [Nanoarchaeota archaeon]